ncbi:alanine racemase [Aminobacter sp. HY435]|uniref:alanine racemase n=1 Tax=Aminobacter sp. HY435 TaxID=2970917 RepID=UPI0022B9CA9C|nr:alanine racemase [Aminobacter sp. HY435]
MTMSVRSDIESRAACGVLTIDLAAIVANYQLLCRQTAPSKAAGVVKADAYGLGVAHVAPALYDAGCRDFFVAHFVEAVRLKPYLPSDARILVLNGLLPGSETDCADLGVVPVLNSLEQVTNWSATAKALGKTLPAAIQVDTGMSRLGLEPQDVDTLLAEPERLASVHVEIVMSHLACGDEVEHDANPRQLARMRAVRARFPDAKLSFANSAGIFLGDDFHGDLARPGIALYGGAPLAGGDNPMRPVVRLEVGIVQTRTVHAGAEIGYGASFVAPAKMRLATIAAGYADGLPRHLSNSGAAFFGGVRLPIVGRVSMDSIILDVTDLPAGTLKLGDMVELIGPHQTLEMIASDAGTISYEILTSLGRRYRRRYLSPAAR